MARSQARTQAAVETQARAVAMVQDLEATISRLRAAGSLTPAVVEALQRRTLFDLSQLQNQRAVFSALLITGRPDLSSSRRGRIRRWLTSLRWRTARR